jgi:hypothetical protein
MNILVFHTWKNVSAIEIFINLLTWENGGAAI